jgi:anti-anti-sigma regulatory factor
MLPTASISVATRGNSLTLLLGGEIDIQTMPQLRSTLGALARRSPSALTLDLTDNRFLCLSGMGALMVLRAGLMRTDVNVTTPGATRTFRELLAHADRVGIPGPSAKPSA